MTPNYTSPQWRAVEEDAARECGRAPSGWTVRLGCAPGDAYAYADANADAYAYADANADAYAYADANAHAYANAYADANADANAYANAYADADGDGDANLYFGAGGKIMRAGLYLFTMPSGSVSVLRIAWLRLVEGDEYEALNCVTPLRKGDYSTLWSDVAIDGPPMAWGFSRPIPGACPVARYHLLGPVPLQPRQWEKICPRPKDWEEP